MELTVKAVAYSETHGANAEKFYRDFEATVKGTLRGQVREFWKGATADAHDVFYLGSMEGTVHLLMAEQGVLAATQGYIVESGVEMAGVLGSYHPVLDARATMTQGELQGDWNVLGDPASNDTGLYGLHLLSQTMGFDSAKLIIDGGPWRIWLFGMTDCWVE